MVIYHAVPDGMVGDILYPLNVLRDIESDLAALHDAKYEGREEVARTVIPTLSCGWGDVLFMSAVHPQTVIDTMLAAGCNVDFSITAYEIPLQMLDMECLTVMETIALGNDGKRFVPFELESLATWQKIPQITTDHYTNMAAKGEQPFTYGGIAHFLYKGTIDVRGLKTVSTK